MNNTPEEHGAAFERAEAMQLDACLEEVAGAGPAADLVHRILAAARSRSPQAAAQRRSRWLAAAVLVVGVGVVAAVAWMQRGKQEHQPALAPQEREKPQGKQEQKPQEPLPVKKGAAVTALKQCGVESLPLLQAAIESAATGHRSEEASSLRAAFDAVAKAANVFAFAEPVTVIADYSDNRVVIINGEGQVLFERNDVFGAWDAEITAARTLLITEFSVGRLEEIDRNGKLLWSFEDLRNPYDADRLPNGNTLIADTFAGRVIEVNPDKKIVWQYDTEIRPFDCDRLANGNTLIADVLKDRVIEVSPEGEIVWEVKNMNNVHDADRLPNGNTLITLRSAGKVIEVDREGKVVWELNGLESPGDADRLPNGHTLVAENKQVREFDRRGNVVWKFLTTWAVEVNRY
jgi:hypothetical protein